jgi:kynureninase
MSPNFSQDLLQQEATRLDQQDPLSAFQDQFLFPQLKLTDGPAQKVVYLVGNSLGLQPKNAKDYIDEVLNSWATLGVEGHFTPPTPYLTYHRLVADGLAELVGANPEDVCAMNGLTTNLHLLLASFYKPEGIRTKILMEA